MRSIVDSVNAFSHFINCPIEGHSGPLKDYKFAVKDVFDIKDLGIQAGNPEYFAQAPIAEETAPAVSLLQNAGATLVGKTHTDELGGSLFGLNTHYGTPLNSNSPDRFPGGSSSGSAAAVAGNLVDFSLGADTSGSVRAPASFCGIYGFRPTLGRISTAGVLPISSHLDTVGIFAQHPNLIAKILTVYEIKEQSKFTRLRIIPSLVNTLQTSLKNNFVKRFDPLKNLISSTKELIIDDDKLSHWSTIIRTIAMHDIWQVHKDWVLTSKPNFGEIVRDRLKMAQSIQYEDYKLALKQKKKMKEFMRNSLELGDLVIFPTVHDIPPLLSSTVKQLKDYALKTSRHTCIAALAGFPEITLPLKNIKSGCSLGMSFLAREDEDYALALFASAAHSIINNDMEPYPALI